MKRLLAASLLFSALVSCSSTPPLADRFRAVDSDRKIVYLAYYPDLNAEQRDEILSNDSESPKDLIAQWKVKPSYSFEDLFKDPRHHIIRALEVLKDGETFSAIAHYEDDRRVDVTSDVTWKVTPKQLHMNANVLELACVSSEAVVSANFVDEQVGSVHFPIERPLEYLELSVDDSSLADDGGYNFRLQLTAHCKDGTHSDVSCLADWSSSGPPGEMSGCGTLNVSRRDHPTHIEDALKVTARYGGLSVTRALPEPRR